MSGIRRAEIMHRIADLVVTNAEELAQLESTDNGKIIRETRSQMQFVARLFRFYAGYADKLFGSVIPARSAGHPRLRNARAIRRHRRHHSLELTA
jgi:acyl-CoA reductase-like NAD-dependent aldehyde dehydrogenase